MNLFQLRLLILVAVSFACVQVSAQIEIKNKIVDFGTLMPIENASVYVSGTTIGVVSNSDGKFLLSIPEKHANDTLVVSSIGYRSFKSVVAEFDGSMDIYLEEDVASLDEVLIVAETRPKTGNDIVLRALEELEDNLPENAYLQKGFLRHKERNKVEYKWLIESALTLYDSSYAAGAKEHLKINIDENRKSYDLRDVDSLYAYTAYLKEKRGLRNSLRAKNLRRDTIKTTTLVNAIRWNDERVNGLDKLFKGKLNIVRNANGMGALFGEKMLDKHQFRLDTVLVENDRKLYKIEILKGTDYVGLNTPGMYNEGFEPNGWLYIYWDTFAFKKIEYELIAASKEQKSRSKSLFGTLLNHKLVINYREFEGKMYPNYIYYETPKLVNIGDRSSDQFVEGREAFNENKDERYYNTIQEIVFTEVIQDREQIAAELNQEWSEDIFSPRPYNKAFWKNYNVLLESEEEEKLIQDLSKRASLFKQ